jgi:hypothetical protein
MAFQIGQEIEHKQFGKGVVTKVWSETRINAQFEQEEFEKTVDAKFLVGFVSIGAAILNIHPTNLPAGFLEYLAEIKDQVEIRIHYPKHAETFVFDLFSREGITLPDDIRALDSGKRGGTTVQRTLAGEMWFPTPANTNILSESYKTADGITKVSQLAVILSVLKAGFLITKCTKLKALA